MSFEDEIIKKKLIFDDLPSPVKRESFIGNQKQAVLLYCRIRPQLDREKGEKPSIHLCNEQTVMSVAPEVSLTYKSNQRGIGHRSEQFFFSTVFGPDASQEDIFKGSMNDMVEDFLGGQNCLLFTYGVTNSGKTHTVYGSADNPGILPRVLDSVFCTLGQSLYTGDEIKPKNHGEVERLKGDQRRTVQQQQQDIIHKAQSVKDMDRLDTCSISSGSESSLASSGSIYSLGAVTEGTFAECTTVECSTMLYEPSIFELDMKGSKVGVWVSCAEIYNEYIYDLFASPIPRGRTRKGSDRRAQPARQSLKVGEDRKHNIFIKGLSEIQVTTSEQAKILASYAQYNRRMGATMLNQNSSRSHSIFTIKLIRMEDSSKPKQAMVNRISIVDLAGSERPKKAGVSGRSSLIKEAGNINNSLLVLGRCMAAMRSNQSKKEKNCIPFRESKLTQIFQNYFIGRELGAREGKVTMFVNVSPSPVVFDETLKVLELSAVAKKVVPCLKVKGKLTSQTTCAVSIQNTVDTPEAHAPLNEYANAETVKKVSSHNSIPVVEDETDTPTPLAQPTGAFVTPGLRFVPEPCRKCENYQKLTEKWKQEMIELKLQLWEQESLIRKEVSVEFQKQITSIQGQHAEAMDEQAASIEAMCEKRMELLIKSVKKTVNTKKRRLEENDEDEEESEVSVLQRKVKQLESDLTAKEKQLTQAHEMLKVQMRKFEGDLVDKNAASNALSVKVASLEKENACLLEDKGMLKGDLLRTKEYISTLQEMIKKLNDDKSLLETSNRNLNEMRKDQDQSMTLYKTHYSRLESLEKELTEKTDQYSDLVEITKQLQSKLEKVSSEKVKLVEKVDALTSDLEDQKRSFSRKEHNLLDDADRKCASLEQQICQLKDSKALMEKDLIDLREALKETKDELKTTKAELKTTKAELKATRDELANQCKKSVSDDQLVILESNLEKSKAMEMHLREEVKDMKSLIEKMAGDHSKQIECLKSHHELAVGELNSHIRDITTPKKPEKEHLTLTVYPESTKKRGIPKTVATTRSRRTRKGRQEAVVDGGIVSKSDSATSIASEGSAHSSNTDQEHSSPTKRVTNTLRPLPAFHLPSGPPSHSSKSSPYKEAACMSLPTASTNQAYNEEEHIYEDPFSEDELNGGKSISSNPSMAHLPNIETSSQIIEEDESGTERLEVAVNFGKKKRALRKRAILTPVEECSSSPRFGSGRKAPVVEDKNDYSTPKKSKKAKKKVQLNEDEENIVNGKTKSSLRNKLKRIINTKGKKTHFGDSTNTPDKEASPSSAVSTPDQMIKGHKPLSYKKSTGKQVRKCQISAPLEILISTPELQKMDNRPKVGTRTKLALRSRAPVNYANF